MNKKENRHVIWSNMNPNFEDWREELELLYPGYDDDLLYSMMIDTLNMCLDDERVNLDVSLSQPILVICDLGLWYGRVQGYKEIKSGNIGECLYDDADFVEWYVDARGDMRCDAAHHDGTNHYLYRVWKDGTTETQRDNLRNKIYEGKATRADITRLTKRIGDEIGKVYGWTFPGMKKGA